MTPTVILQATLVAVALLAAGCSRHTTQAAGAKGGPRLIVLGVDGMDPGFIEAHWDSLPNLARLRRDGDFRRLATTVPPQSPVAWSTVITGMDPGGHGIFDFIHRNPSTRMPISSMAETTEPSRTLAIGPYSIPLAGGGVRTLRTGVTFWELLAKHGVHSTVIRMPANFPPAECESESLAGMGTPDLQGSFGTFTFFTDDPAEKRTQVPGGHVTRVEVRNGRATLRLEGPANELRRDHGVAAMDLLVHVDPTAPVARFTTGGEQVILRQGEWSGWLKASFPLIPALASASGIFRIYLQQTHPYLRVYISPINIDPQHPDLPISTPKTFSRSLAEALGPFYTQGIAEEASAYRAGIFNRAEFLVQSHKVLDDSLRMFRHELDRFSSGLLFYYFSSVDQNSHMLWGKYDSDLLEIYRAVDNAIGEAMAKAGSDTKLMVISDHGFANFDRAVHLNSWLMRDGMLTLDDPSNASDQEGFAHVDWGKTEAYAVGLNGIYLNLDNRERGGIVSVAEKLSLLDRIAERLLAFKDPRSGERVVEKVYFPEAVFKGRNLKYAPDLFVGFRRGYRASWQTALGAVPKTLIDDNTQAWIGDHCMAAHLVPGVLFSNRRIRADRPELYDITATILDEFGVPKTGGMIGHTVF
jgi:predicted AlkP superfamily phosphohydrolase/phosphomutase